MDDGRKVRGESNITAAPGKKQELFLIPGDVNPLPQALAAIERADLITMGQGRYLRALFPMCWCAGLRRPS